MSRRLRLPVDVIRQLATACGSGVGGVQEGDRVTLMEHARQVSPGKWLDWWHVGAMIEALESACTGEIKNLLLMAPRRVHKSHALQVAMSWRIRTQPMSNVLLGGATKELMLEHGGNMRDMCEMAGVMMKMDTMAKGLWKTESGGKFKAVTVRGGNLGFGFDLGVVDDPFGKIEDWESPAVQKATWKWFRIPFQGSKQGRPEGGPATTIVMQQRLDFYDLAGYLMEWLESTGAEDWHVLSLKGFAEDKAYSIPKCCTMIEDPRPKGEPLCDDGDIMAPIKARRKYEPDLHSIQDQQRPVKGAGGGVFCGTWFRTVGRDVGEHDAETACLMLASQGRIDLATRRARGFDLKAGGGDAFATVRGARCGGRFLVENATETFPPAASIKGNVMSQARADGFDVEVVLPSEPAIGVLFVLDLQRELRSEGFTVHLFPQRGPKRSRALSFAAMSSARCESCTNLIVPEEARGKFSTQGICRCDHPEGTGYGQVDILAGPWNQMFRERHHAFTGEEGGLDDVIDAAVACHSILFGDVGTGTVESADFGAF